MKLKLRDAELIPILFFIACYCLPIVFIKVHWGSMLALTLLYTFSTAILSRKKKVIGAVLISTAGVLLIVGLLYLIGDLNTGAEAISKIWSMVMCVFPVYLLYRIFLQRNKNRFIFLVWVVIAMFFVTAVLTILELVENPSACRMFVLQTELYERNVGHFDFIYAIPPMIVVFTLLYNKAKAGRIVYIGLIILALATLLMSGYTLALLTVMIAWALIFLKRKKADIKTILAVLLICGAVAAIFPFALKALAQWVPHKSMSIRLTEMYNAMFKGDDSGYNMTGRMDIYKEAIRVFFKGFITGNGELEFSPHSAFLSIAAHTGIWGTVCLYFLLRHQRQMVQHLVGEKTTAFAAGYTAFLITGFTNPVLNCYMHSFCVFCLIPLTVCTKGDFYGKGESDGEQRIETLEN